MTRNAAVAGGASPKISPDGIPARGYQGLHFRDDLIRVVRLRNEARDRATQRQRRHAYAAAARLAPLSNTPDEVEIRRETAVLYARIINLTDAGKLRWDKRTQDWVLRPVFARTDQTRPPSYTADELLSRFEHVRRTGKRWTARCPAHDDRTPSLAIAEGSKGWLVKCWTGCDFTVILAAAGLEPSRMFYQ